MIWVFHRGGERLRYEIRRAAAQDQYELRLTYPDGRSHTDQVTGAAEFLERCTEVARKLEQEGWRAA